MSDIMGLSKLQDRVREKLGIKRVILVPGSCDENGSLLKDVTRYGCEYFLGILKDGDIVSITGGSTMLEFSNVIKTDKRYPNSTIVPARGSMGTDVEMQSNNIVASISKKLHSNCKLLHIPDELDESAMKTLSQVPEIKTTLEYIKRTDILVFSIGRADVMAKRRKLPEDKVDEILSKNAVGEAFGYYFNKDGEIVYKLNTVGIDLETVKQVKETIAIFAGTEKVEALLAISNMHKNMVLVTDEESAYKILSLL